MGKVFARVRAKLNPKDFDIEPKKAITGALIIEIPGEGSKERADRLFAAMVAAERDSGVTFARPVNTCEMRVKGLDDSVTPEEVRKVVITVGSCRSTVVQVGRARASPNRLFTVWVRCPVAAARKIADTGSIKVWWVQATVEVMGRQPLQCHRCLWREHVVATCTYTAPEEDRRDRCFRCGGRGHHSADCSAPAKCPLCSDLCRPAAHQLGRKACAPIPRKGKRGAKKATEGKNSGPSPTQEAAPAAAPAAAEVAGKVSQSPLSPSSGVPEEAMEVEVLPTP
ncbi:uncharacterized protein LOC109860742 [Pseudomyrmex gracilis]|uniref:uncharacterized protein LOC109860742 n=1 Tax=Pseudomyrmex gracilis TaxID=219809 RepID=UPI000995C361|nr:uncharacterized protein LOC109860742 [Pseudomyrmex gracilis]